MVDPADANVAIVLNKVFTSSGHCNGKPPAKEAICKKFNITEG
jgi:hypothetical protein